MLAVSWSNKCAPHCHFMGPLLTLMTWSRISKWNISSRWNRHHQMKKKVYIFKRPLWWVCFKSVYSVNGYPMSSWSVIYGIGIEKGNYSSPYLAPWRTMVYGPWGNHPRVEKRATIMTNYFSIPGTRPFSWPPLPALVTGVYFFKKFVFIFAKPKNQCMMTSKNWKPKEGAAGTKNQ